MRRVVWFGIAAGLTLAAVSPLPAPAATYTLVLPQAGATPMPYLSIRVDDPGSSTGSPAVDVGAGDFTVELFVKAAPNANPRQVDCTDDATWAFGHVLLDRSRGAAEGARSWGVSLSRARMVFGIIGPSGARATLCGTRVVADDYWHHVAIQRRAADGRITIWVDGTLDVAAAGPSGDVSYPDDATVPIGCANCGQDPFLFIGGKSDQSAESFVGSIDELRVSTVIRYAAPFSRPARAFAADASTAALLHFDDGSGRVARDSAGSHHASFGTDAAALPRWSSGSPFASLPGRGPAPDGGPAAKPAGSAGRPAAGRSPAASASPSAAPANTPENGTRRNAGGRAVPPRTSALAAAAPIAGGVAAVGFLIAVIVLGIRRASQR